MCRKIGEDNDENKSCCCCSLLMWSLFASVVGTFLGLIAFIIFGYRFKNWHASAWALVSGVVSFVNVLVILQHEKSYWFTRLKYLKLLVVCGVLAQLFGVCAFVVYLIVAIKIHQGLILYGNGYYITLVWCFMTWKAGLALYLASSKIHKSIYQGKIQLEDHHPLLYENA